MGHEGRGADARGCRRASRVHPRSRRSPDVLSLERAGRHLQVRYWLSEQDFIREKLTPSTSLSKNT